MLKSKMLYLKKGFMDLCYLGVSHPDSDFFLRLRSGSHSPFSSVPLASWIDSIWVDSTYTSLGPCVCHNKTIHLGLVSRTRYQILCFRTCGPYRFWFTCACTFPEAALPHLCPKQARNVLVHMCQMCVSNMSAAFISHAGCQPQQWASSAICCQKWLTSACYLSI